LSVRRTPAPEDDFAAESNGSVAGTLFDARYGGDPPSRLITSTARFAVLADLAPLCAGHVLVLPRTFRQSFGALPAAWWPELEALLATLGDALVATFGTPSIVEHGSSSQLRRSPCVSHAHLHLLPMPVELSDDLRGRGVTPSGIDSLRDVTKLAALDHAYLCWGPSDGPLAVADVEEGGVPRQYVRRQLTTALGHESWDWGVPSPPELLRTTVRDLRAVLQPTEPSHALAH
jgi:diadenosine tetraphosphate (Ap4A) HIT family hydrolase